ncbi:MAG: hypothetical protein WCJ35_23105 [Planctomycetota bacterium]
MRNSLRWMAGIGVGLLVWTTAIAAENPATSAPAATCEVVVDFAKPLGKLRALHGVNNGPAVEGNHTADMASRHKEAGFPSVRLHDCRWPNPNVVDIPAIFPLFHADADDPQNYVFAPTDRYLEPIAARGVQIVYRLGVSIEHKSAFHTQPPVDFNKWAKICINIIRHYNDGWANGRHYGIKYFEIWNEPDIGRQMWTGTPQQYFDLYKVAVTAIKAYNPAIKVGNQVSQADGKFARQFLAYCRDQKLPLDFFDWHCYTSSPSGFIQMARTARQIADEYGFQQAESLCTEWKPMLVGWDAVSWSPNRPASSVHEAFARNRNHEAAAFAASALILMQDAPLDMAHFYTADDSPWSMFDEYGVPGKVFFAFKAFHQFLQTPNRVAVTGGQLGGDQVTLCAAIADDRKSAALLLSNFRGRTTNLRVVLQNLPLTGTVRTERYVVDEKHGFEAMEPLVDSEASRVLSFALPPATVCLVKLSQ